MGIMATVYRAVGTQLHDGSVFQEDCTNKGWSSIYNTVCVVNAEGPFTPSAEFPAVMLVRHRMHKYHSVHAVLKSHNDQNQWTMMGGNFLHTSDSRFYEAVRMLLKDAAPAMYVDLFNNLYPGAIPIHDRIEG